MLAKDIKNRSFFYCKRTGNARLAKETTRRRATKVAIDK